VLPLLEDDPPLEEEEEYGMDEIEELKEELRAMLFEDPELNPAALSLLIILRLLLMNDFGM
jgi:hypothetical protein